MTTQARELAKLVTNAGDVNLGDDISLASDGAVLNFGADSDVTLTHVADTGLLLNSSRRIQFGDSGTHIRQSADGVLNLTSDTEVEINATTVDINANVDISGNLVLGGNITIGDADSDDISFGGELTSHIVPNATNTYDLGTASKEWRNAFFDGTVTADAFAGPLTGDVTGNTSGTAATVTTAAQTNITSLGTLTALTVDNLGVNGNTITANSGALNLTPASGSAIVLDGTINVDAGVVTGATSITSTAFVGGLTGNVTGNASGTALTVTQAAQTAITSVGTLTSLAITGDLDIADTGAGAITIGGTTNTYNAPVVINATDLGIAISDGTKTLAMWGVHGGSSHSGSAVGTRSNHDLALITNDAKRMVVTSAGNVLIGDTAANAHANVDDLIIGNTTGHHGIQIRSNSGSNGAIFFGDEGSHLSGQLEYAHNGDILYIITGGATRARIDSDGLKFGSDSAAANALDDYEEGTWTPALDNITTNSSTMYGIYTKIGRIVHIHAKIDVTVASLPGAQFQISGLPYAATNTSDTGQRAIIAVGGDSLNIGAAAPKGHFITNGSTLKGVFWNASNNTEIWYYNSGDGNSFQLHIHGHYTT